MITLCVSNTYKWNEFMESICHSKRQVQVLFYSNFIGNSAELGIVDSDDH